MLFKIRYFASIRESVGKAEENLQINHIASIEELRNLLVERGGGYAEALEGNRAVRCAINQVMVNETALLMDGAEVAFFPPVTGG